MNGLTRIIHALSITAFALLFLQGCSEDANSYNGEVELSQTELQIILETDDAAGAVDSALAELFTLDATASKSTGVSNECYSAEYTQTGYTVTFNNCVLNGTENINGTLTVTYNLENETSAFTATYVDFYVGTLKLNGTRSYTLGSDIEQGTIAFTVVSNMSVEMEDESVISENGTKVFSFTFGENLETSIFTLSGTWQVEADGNTYIVETITDLTGNFGCEYLTSGSMDVNKNGLTITIDFGDGTCDNVATLVFPNGNTQEVTL